MRAFRGAFSPPCLRILHCASSLSSSLVFASRRLPPSSLSVSLLPPDFRAPPPGTRVSHTPRPRHPVPPRATPARRSQWAGECLPPVRRPPNARPSSFDGPQSGYAGGKKTVSHDSEFGAFRAAVFDFLPRVGEVAGVEVVPAEGEQLAAAESLARYCSGGFQLRRVFCKSGAGEAGFGMKEYIRCELPRPFLVVRTVPFIVFRRLSPRHCCCDAAFHPLSPQ